VFIELRRGRYDDDVLERQLNSRGLMRFFAPLTRSIDRSWKMYPLGILFGLGFDTATEVALLVLAGTSVAAGLPFWAILSLPILFAAGMSLLDTIDGSFMNFAYGWAFSRPVRKVYYNLTITGLSIAVAVFIGGLEVAQVLSDQLGLTGGFWDYASRFDINHAGYVIVGMFVAIWVVALGIWRFGRVEARWETAAARARQSGDNA
jgi:high-affinity nickel-transport protein